MVTIYTAEHCNFCKMAKEYFEENGVEYQEKKIEEERYLKEVANMGRVGVPVIIYNGIEIAGFQEEVLDEMLKEGNQ